MENLLLEIVYAVLTVILPIVTKYLINWLSSLKIKTQNQTLDKYIEMGSKAVVMAVANVNQTYVDTLKKNGEFNEVAQQEAFNKAKETAMLMLSDNVKTAIEIVYKDIDVYLDAKIEETINNSKTQIIANLK